MMKSLLPLVTALLSQQFDAAAGACEMFDGRRADILRLQQLEHGVGTPFTPTDANKKHTPVITFDEVRGYGTVTVGTGTTSGETQFIHPTDRPGNHFISTIYVTNYETGEILTLNMMTATTDSPSLRIAIPNSQTIRQIEAFAFCNIHGLYSSGPISVPGTFSSTQSCSLESCNVDTVGVENNVCAQFDVLEKDLLRRQQNEQGQSTPFVASDSNKKHTPVLVLSEKLSVLTGRVTIGLGSITGVAAETHGNTFSTDPNVIHYIEFIYVKDQNDVIIAAGSYSVSDVAAFEFPVPKGVQTLTPFVMCNIHGAFVGETVTVDQAAIVHAGSQTCGTSVCWGSVTERGVTDAPPRSGNNNLQFQVQFQVTGEVSYLGTLVGDVQTSINNAVNGNVICGSVCSTTTAECYYCTKNGLQKALRAATTLASDTFLWKLAGSGDVASYSAAQDSIKASLTSLFAALNGATFDSTSVLVSNVVVNTHTDDDDGLSGGAIAGIVIGSVVFVVIIVVIIKFCCCKETVSEPDAENSPDGEE
eukprot:TRINITY_DN14234_c0_g1_i1.p1 TRINITY_DN14234_c0_g1~~TRINITY_DN14234_c0_g1_i1.p1  ORF type:complete len:546 (+),score=128.44 TRINITY_DN14234_c0_g1_i1:44-1639(+)